MNMRQTIFAALRGDPELVPKVRHALRERIDEKDGPVATMVQAAGALEPVIADAVRKRPSKLGKLVSRARTCWPGSPCRTPGQIRSSRG